MLLVDAEVLKFNFSNFETIPLPLDPEVRITGIVAEKATLFKVQLNQLSIPVKRQWQIKGVHPPP